MSDQTQGRINCCVPFCTRTRHNRDNTSEWICGTHWRLVPQHLKRRKFKLFRRYRRLFGDSSFWCFEAGSEKRIQAVRLDRLCGIAWDRCKAAAIERSVGL
ncbi:hypothetical protein F9L08_03345 [Brucella tritici]|uniref:Uncharacterized protein n=1 Tax=Brucella tritici TaxID=94626 RepID=A0A6L3YW23_9HYPH|nr:hypothetical protein F9K77_15910 [Ochrobactrum sp. LMG 5442]KAB2689708.1 hypothetical protein F9L08_03345 [Brucella tritici]